MRPHVCVPCHCFYRCKRNGTYVEEGMPEFVDVKLDAEAITSTKNVEWISYKLWEGDLWECPRCKHQIVTGFARCPASEHYQEGYAEKVKAADPICFVDDC